MSSEALVEGPNGVLAAWETEGQVRWARLDPASRQPGPAVTPPGGSGRKHPALAVSVSGETLLAWTEGTGWNRGGALAWQLYDTDGRALPERGRVGGAIPVWGLAAAIARPDGGFLIIH
ncbi:MAG TPA: hypothetical protein VFU47_04030 [Armatimonadota bacterium]|nr:hypothetical protein [Armatimonadota bacterium]